jgi:hypothetical protein
MSRKEVMMIFDLDAYLRELIEESKDMKDSEDPQFERVLMALGKALSK